MNSPDEPALEDQGGRGSLRKKGRSRKGLRVATTAGMALGLTVVGAGAAGAATNGTGSPHAHHTGMPGSNGSNGRGRPAVSGTVATVGANSFTVTTRSGSTLTVDVTDATTYRDPGVTSPSFANVKVGETVVVFGTETSGTVAATSVGIGTSAGPGGSFSGRPASRPGGRPGGSGGRAGARPTRPPTGTAA